jgi:long-chain acyl-CoA synthetase
MTLHEMIIGSARAHPAKKAFNFLRDGKWASITYKEFVGMACSAANFLKGQGLQRGGRVAIISENRPEWCAFYLGTLISGAVSVPVDVRLTPGEVKNILEHSEAEMIVFSNKMETIVKEAAADININKINMDSVNLEKIGEAELGEASEDDMASLLYTSGTTGTPKGVMLSHGNLCSDVEAMMEVRIIGPDDNVLSALPLHHTYPFMCTFALSLSVGACVTYPAGLKGTELVDAVTATGVTVFIAVPRMLEIMRDRIFARFEEMPGMMNKVLISLVRLFGSIREKLGVNLGRYLFARKFGWQFRFFACGGARLEPQVMRDMEALGFTVVEGYGLTETSPIVAFNPIDRRKPGSVGRAVKGAEIKIISPDEKGIGEVAIRGPMVMRGYYKNSEATESVLKGGWFYTGDMGRIDGDGYLSITGRAKEVIVLSSGKNIYPEDVEKHYSAIPLIKELCVLAVDDRLHAVIVPDTEHKVEGNFEKTLRAEIKSLSENIASHMRIAGYTLSDTPLPRTPLGKLRRFMVVDIVKGKKEKKEEDPALSDDTSRKVLECLGHLSEEPGPYRSTDDIELDLGLDSLKRLEMVSALESEFNVRLPESFAYEVRTVGELVSSVKNAEAVDAGGMGDALWGEPSAEEKRRAGLRRSAYEWPVSAAAAMFLKLLFKLLFGLEVKGMEKIPGPPFIIAPNHLSIIDGLVVTAAVPLGVFRYLYFQGYFKYFEGPVKSLFGKLSHVISIDPSARLSHAMRLSHHVLVEGDGLCIFPEGQRSFDGETGIFKKGIGILARKLDVPVVPAKIEGTFEVLPRGKLVPRPGKVRITFGEPLKPSAVDYSARAESVDEDQHFADVLKRRVRDL